MRRKVNGTSDSGIRQESLSDMSFFGLLTNEGIGNIAGGNHSSNFQNQANLQHTPTNNTSNTNTTSSEEPKDSLSSLESVETASASSWKRGELPHLINNYSLPNSQTALTSSNINSCSYSTVSTFSTSSPNSTSPQFYDDQDKERDGSTTNKLEKHKTEADEQPTNQSDESKRSSHHSSTQQQQWQTPEITVIENRHNIPGVTIMGPITEL